MEMRRPWPILFGLLVPLAMVACKTVDRAMHGVAYEARGLNERQHTLWHDQLGLNVETLDAYLDIGLDPSEAIQWATGVDDARHARSVARDVQEQDNWQPVFSPEEVVRWRSIEAKADSDQGAPVRFNPADAKAYREKGLTPVEAAAWEAQVEEYLDMRYRDPVDLLTDFEELDISISDAHRWVEYGFVATHPGSERAEDWIDFTPSEARRRLDAGQMPSAARAEIAEEEAWQDVGLPQEERERLKELDYDPEGVAGLLEANFKADDFDAWSFWSRFPGRALAWHQAGISPDAAKRWGRLPFTQSRLLEVARTTQPECPDGPRQSEPAHENPYAVEGKCYVLTGRVIQLWSQSEGLVQERGQPMLLRAPDDLLPGEGRELLAVVLGTGATTYEAAAGHEQTVAIFRVIKMVLTS